MKIVPCAVLRFTPLMMVCATLVAEGSFTARAPVSVAYLLSGLTPVQSWQLAQAPAKIFSPRGSRSAVTPWRCAAGAGTALGRAGGEISGEIIVAPGRQSRFGVAADVIGAPAGGERAYNISRDA